MANVGLRMLDDLYHHKLASLDKNWADDSFAPIPAFVDTGSSLIDKNNVEGFQAANQSMNAAQ
jgi:ribose transport system substrate-binding protein